MRSYLFGTGIIPALTGGYALLRGLRGAPFTWRTALALLSWGISVALAVGAIVDTRRAKTGHLVDEDSPIADKADTLLKKNIER